MSKTPSGLGRPNATDSRWPRLTSGAVPLAVRRYEASVNLLPPPVEFADLGPGPPRPTAEPATIATANEPRRRGRPAIAAAARGAIGRGDAERGLGDGLVHDQLFDGRKVRALTIIDTFTRPVAGDRRAPELPPR